MKREVRELSKEFDRFLKAHEGHVRRGYIWLCNNLPWLFNGNFIEHHGIKGQKWGVRNGPPYPLEKSVKQTIIKAKHISLDGPPNAVIERANKNGGIDRNYYDENGKQTKQISNHNHGNPKHHDYGKHGEHAHDYIYDENGNLVDRTIRELSDKERKENDDIL